MFRTFYLSRRVMHKIQYGFNAIHEGLWLGILKSKKLRELSDYHYQASGDSDGYDDRDWNLSGLHRWETVVVDQYFSECKTVLLGAAGGGREIVALSKKGIRVDGFECCRSLMESCRQLLSSLGITSEVIYAEPDTVPDQFGVYDGLIMGWGSYAHIIGQKQRVQLLTDFRQHVQPGGPLLLSFFTRTRDSAGFRLTTGLANFIRRISGAELIEVGDRLTTDFRHFFLESEIREELNKAGFDLQFYSTKPYGHAIAVRSMDIMEDVE